jgi:hypothetical protein
MLVGTRRQGAARKEAPVDGVQGVWFRGPYIVIVRGGDFAFFSAADTPQEAAKRAREVEGPGRVAVLIHVDDLIDTLSGRDRTAAARRT